jgi:hypothetical protein
MNGYAWIDCGNGRQVYKRIERHEPQRSHLPRPYTKSDGMSDTWNPVDGRRYDSKSQYERAVKEAGCEIVGDDKGHWSRSSPEYKPEGVAQDIKQAWDQLSS